MPRAQANRETAADAAALGRPDLAASCLTPARMVCVPRPDGASEDEDEQALEACIITVNEQDQGRMGEYAVLFSDAPALLVGAAVHRGKDKLTALLNKMGSRDAAAFRR